MVPSARWAMLAALGASAMACVQDSGTRQGAGYVVGAAGELTVRIAWPYDGCTEDGTPAMFAVVTGETAVVDGQFDLEDIADVSEDPMVPVDGCPGNPLDRDEEPDADVPPSYRNPAWGRLVATDVGLDPPDEGGMNRDDLASSVRAVSADIAVVWSGVEVLRDEETGVFYETGLGPGGQLMRIVTCLTRPAVGEPCFDPLPDDAIVLLGN